MTKHVMSNHIGEKHNRLTVIEYIGKDQKKKPLFKCRCDCGKEKIIRLENVRSGGIKSCGCLKVEKSLTHGMYQTRLYRIYNAMMQRCNNPNNTNFRNYGRRGISVCKEWDNFERFKKWAEKTDYKDNLTIERINNNLNYSPENCTWVDRKTQANNRRDNLLVEYKGQMMTIKQASEKSGVHHNTIAYRLRRGKPLFKKSPYIRGE